MTDQNYRHRLGQAIRARRKEIGVSVAEIAETLGVTTQAFYEWERGDKSPDWNRLPALARTLKTTPKKLIPSG